MDEIPRPVRAPRTAGGTLRLLARVVETRAGAALLGRTLLHSAGVPLLRSTPAQDAPWPLGQVHSGGLESPSRREAIPEALWDLPPGGLGPRFGVGEFLQAYRSGEADPVTVAEAVLAACADLDGRSPPLRALIAQDRDDVLGQARESRDRWASGRPLGPLDGVPVAVKDELDCRPYPTTVGTSFRRDVPGDDATAVARIRAAGAVIIGKANMHEIGIGVTGVNPHHGAARNPHDLERVTGGSSSGSAAAVAAGLCPVALGADGGGSIRIPASFCGVVGLKPTFGRVSEHGAAPLCWSVAHVGPIGASVRDVALAFALIAGPDPRDPGSLSRPPLEWPRFGDPDLRGIRVGVHRAWIEDADPPVVDACRRALEVLESAGARVIEVQVPELALFRVVHLVTIVSEMRASQAALLPHHRRDYGADTRLSLALAGMLRSEDYVHAQRVRTRLVRHLHELGSLVDVLATPTTPCTAPRIPRDALASGESNLPLTTRIMQYVQAANLAGLPAISVPCGKDPEGLPVGLQLMGRPWEESLLLRMAAVVEAGIPVRSAPMRVDLLARARSRA